MPSSSAPLQRSDDRLLLAQQGAVALPSPIALQLLDIPFVLPLQKQPARVDGRLPESVWRLDYELTATDRTRYRVRVTGDPFLGLPYGRDADVLLALFRILDDGRDTHDLGTGTFHHPNFQMICGALGMAPSGPLVQRIRDALRRLSHVRIESRVLVDRSMEASRVLAQDGTAVPSAATGATTRRHEVEESRWLLEYRTETRTVEERRGGSIGGPPDGEDNPGGQDDPVPQRARVERTLWIHELRVNPFWVSQAISGWAGWIDVERHAGLNSITARRLYQLCAAQAARHLRLPWVLSEAELRTACMLSTDGKKPTRVRQILTDAAEELEAAGVLASHGWHGTPRRGVMEFVLNPGPLLQLGGLLRGVGLTDPPDMRVSYALLRAFGVSAVKARALIGEKPGQVGEVLLRACHLRATDPDAVTKSWAGWIVHHIDHDTSFAGEVAFQQWRRTTLAKLDQPTPALQGSGQSRPPRQMSNDNATPAARGPATASPVLTEPGAWERFPAGRPHDDPIAVERWQRVVDDLRPELAEFDRYWVSQAVALPSTPGELVVSVPDWTTEQGLLRLVPRLNTALTTREGQAVAVRVALAYQPSAAPTRRRAAASRSGPAPQQQLEVALDDRVGS